MHSFRTGALHVGDRILAINGQTLRRRPLSEAITMLQDSGHCVTLKISRPLQPQSSSATGSTSGMSTSGAGTSSTVTRRLDCYSLCQIQ